MLPTEGALTVESLPSLGRGELFCDAYEQFRSCCPQTEISFERAVTPEQIERVRARARQVRAAGGRA